jgi:sialate O-acetylesterase
MLDAMEATAKSSPLKVSSGGQSITRKNVVVGDLVLVARQTSVDISLGRNAAGKAAAAAYVPSSNVRAIVIKTIPAINPLNDLNANATAGWATINGENALDMTGSTFYMVQALGKDREVPIGIVDINLGYQFPIAWLSRPALEETGKFYQRTDVPGVLSWADKQLAVVYEGQEANEKFHAVKVPEEYPIFPAGGYNAVLHPLRGVSLAGLIVQLGNDYPYMVYEEILKSAEPFDRKELKRAYVETYDVRKVGFQLEESTTPRIAREWRKAFGDTALPFGLIVPPGSDLATFGQHNREMRELQRLTAEGIDGVDIIMPGMQNQPFSAQPQDDVLLGHRCSSWVRGAVFLADEAPSTGPLFDRMEPNFNEAILHFKKGTATGLKAIGDALDYFEVAGVEGDYSPARATIEGDVVRIASDTVSRIARVRYNWNLRPNEGLINAAGLPAVPFRTENEGYRWFIRHKDDDLPEEYSLPANEWTSSDVSLINGQMQSVGYDNFTGMIGPVGILTGPFGPNMGVREVLPGSPADGKLFEGDVIYSANGVMLGEKAWEVMGAAITESETRKGQGKLVLGVRRLGENMDVEISLDVLGSYSPTSPYDCPKTEKIIENLNAWVWANGAKAGFLQCDALYMLATGDPKFLARVRQIVYSKIKGKDPNRPINPTAAGKSWHNSADALLLGEYYFATGDKTVLPHLKHACDRLAATQNKEYGGWRHNFPGGASYGFIPNAGLPGVMGMYFADKAGLDIDQDAYALGLTHYTVGKAETGHMIYGSGHCRRDTPPVFDYESLENGTLSTYNGAVSAAGILMRFVGNQRAEHMCSFISSYAWNMTFPGHGGNFWNNFWTPLGAHNYGKMPFIRFWKNYRWYREMNRMYNGGLMINEGRWLGAATGLPLVAPRRRLQILGAPASPFAADAPAFLKPALEAHANGEYEKCNQLVQVLLASGTVPADNVETVEFLGRSALEWKESLSYDDKLGAITEDASSEEGPSDVQEEEAPLRTWDRLVAQLENPKENKGKPDRIINARDANVWRIQVVEHLSQAPEGWTQPGFDDADWPSTTLPISWRMNHTALLRTTFEVDDPSIYDKLMLSAWVFRQQGIEICLNGKLMGKINNIEDKTGNIESEFNDSALKLLRKGTNTLTISTRHNWRWGMLFMNVYNNGFDFNLDARIVNP